MPLSLIIFDCDGVLLESMDAKTRAFHRIGLEYGEEAADRLVLFHSIRGGVNRLEKFAWFYEEVLGKKMTEADAKAMNEKFVEYCFDEIRTCILVPGIEDVLKKWHKRVPMYVASGAPHDELLLVLKERKLDHYFEEMYGAPPHKSALLQKILQKTQANPAETIMIGDSQTDLSAAEDVQCLFYGRGKYFKDSGYPWHHDLTKLNAHLEGLI